MSLQKHTVADCLAATEEVCELEVEIRTTILFVCFSPINWFPKEPI